MDRLTDQQDAFGHLLDDFQREGTATELIERDDGLLAVGNTRNYFGKYRDFHRAVKQALRLARGKVLDIGCGAGRHSIHLQSKGLAVLGVDQSPLAVKVSRLRGLRQAKVVDLSELPARLGTFDTVIMLGNNFGLFGSAAGAQRLLGRLAGMTSANARLIVESMDPYGTQDLVHLAYHRRNRARGRMSGQVRLRVRHGIRATPWFDYLLVSQEEMRKIVQATPWRIERFIASVGPNYLAVLGKGNRQN